MSCQRHQERETRHIEMTMLLRLLATALVVAAVAGQDGRPVNTQGRPVDRTPPPGKANRESVSGDRPPPSVDRQGAAADRMYLLQSNGFNVEVNAASPVPFFRFWSDTDNIQMVKLDRMFQTSSSSDLSASDPLSPVRLHGAYDWAFGDASSTVDATTNTTDVQFTVTGTAKQAGTAEKPTPGMVFTCHLLSNANGTEMKFDVAVSGFDDSWWATGAEALVIGYKVSTVDSNKRDKANMTMSDIRVQDGAQRPNRPSTSGDSSAAKRKIAMDFGNGNGMEVVAEATQTGGGTLWVSMTAISTPNGGSYVLTMYQKFSSGFTHDPNLYTAATSGTVAADSPTLGGLPVVSIGADTGVIASGTTPPPENENGCEEGALCSSASSIRVSWMGIAALVAMLFATGGGF
uniref:DOMON domain-containing protein n=1 Tax=Hemiselmis andersenii TaxID=464988 RepID=A0A7S0XU24_HEMAN